MPGCSINDSINVNTGQNNEMSAMRIIFYTISGFFNLSFDTERFAFSRISGGTTGSDLACAFRLILAIRVSQKPAPEKQTETDARDDPEQPAGEVELEVNRHEADNE